MKAVLLRTGSVPVPDVIPRSKKVSASRHGSVAGILSGEKNPVSSPRVSLHSETGRSRVAPIRRAFSQGDVIGSLIKLSAGSGPRPFPAMMQEEDMFDGEYARIWEESEIPVEELGFSGDGIGNGKKSGGGNGVGGEGNDGNGGDLSEIGSYYKQMLKSNPGDSLLLRNYGKFLHEVEGDLERAEEYYGRAILASPGDGEVLSLYGKVIWDSEGDGERAKSYFDQAVSASPNDCMVLGSYAHFLWEAEEHEDDEEVNVTAQVSPAMVAAF